jgi:hypothetical protein
MVVCNHEFKIWIQDSTASCRDDQTISTKAVGEEERDRNESRHVCLSSVTRCCSLVDRVSLSNAAACSAPGIVGCSQARFFSSRWAACICFFSSALCSTRSASGTSWDVTDGCTCWNKMQKKPS